MSEKQVDEEIWEQIADRDAASLLLQLVQVTSSLILAASVFPNTSTPFLGTLACSRVLI